MKEKTISRIRKAGNSASKVSIGSFVLAVLTFGGKVGLNALSNFMETGTSHSQAEIDAKAARERDILEHRKQAIDAAEQNRVFLQEKAKAEAEVNKWAVEQAETKRIFLQEKAKLEITSKEEELKAKVNSLTEKNELLNNRIEALKEKDDYIKELKENNESLKKKISAMANV